MALPLLARGLGAVISTEAVLQGRLIGVALGGLIDDLLGPDKDRTEITVPVASSCISTIGYKVGGIITVEFKRGGTYEYMGTEEVFMAFLTAPSKGVFFNTHFR